MINVISLVIFASLATAAMANPRAEALKRSSASLLSKESHQCTDSDFERKSNCQDVALNQNTADSCTALEKFVNQCPDTYLAQCMGAASLREYKDGMVRIVLKVADKNKESSDMSCPVVKEYIDSGRGADYATIMCKQDELDDFRRRNNECIQSKEPLFKQQVQRVTTKSALNDLLCQHVKELLSECIQQVNPCFLDDEMKEIRGNFVVALAQKNPRTFSNFNFKECFA